jgi:hypothetical protein
MMELFFLKEKFGYDNSGDEQREITEKLKNAFNREKGREYRLVSQNGERTYRARASQNRAESALVKDNELVNNPD